MADYIDRQKDFVKLESDRELQGGDVVIYKFKILPGWLFVKQAGIAAIESKLNEDNTIRRWSANYEEFDQGYVYYKVWIRDVYPQDFEGPLPQGSIFDENKPEIQKAGIGYTVFALGAMIAGFALGRYFSMSTVKVAALKAVESGNITPEQAENILGSNSLGTQINKAGWGVAIPILAIALLLFVKKR